MVERGCSGVLATSGLAPSQAFWGFLVIQIGSCECMDEGVALMSPLLVPRKLALDPFGQEFASHILVRGEAVRLLRGQPDIGAVARLGHVGAMLLIDSGSALLEA